MKNRTEVLHILGLLKEELRDRYHVKRV